MKRKRLLFVCTGNTCRSPMAAALWRQMGGEAESAGLYAREGEPASANAVWAMDELGLDLTGHTARTVTEEMLRAADAAVCMTAGHAQALCARFPSMKDKVFVMPLEIPDPFGGDAEEYRACAERMRDALLLLG